MTAAGVSRPLSLVPALFCRLARLWPCERGKSFLLRVLDRISPPVREIVSVRYDADLGLDVFWDDVAGRTSALFGEHDGDVSRFLDFLFAREKGGVFVDAGANLGLFSLRLALREGVTCEAFEPQPRLISLLERNIARNGLAGRVRIHPVALGAVEGEARMELNEGNSYVSRIGEGGGMAVPLRRLDGEIGVEEWKRVVAVKVDVEGFEIDVFNGASGLFAHRRPPLVFELNTRECEQRGRPPRLFREALEACGYRHFYALDRALYPIANGIFVSANLVALSPEDAALRDAFGFDPVFRPRPRPQWPVVEVEF